MRIHVFVLMSVLLAHETRADTPAMCAIPSPSRPAVDARPQGPTPSASATPATVGIGDDPTPLPKALALLPFVRHVAASGAIITDLGTAHGLREIAARHGSEFGVFEVAADGQSAVRGVVTELSPKQLAEVATDLTTLPPEHGFRGSFVRSGPQFQVMYETPDGERVIPGVLYDADGKDLTRGQVVNIPGAIATVVVGSDASQPSAASIDGTNAAASTLVQKAASGTVGPVGAPHLWVLIDPQCIYSVRAYQSLRPYATAGKLQLTVVPLSMLDYEDQGQSTRSALALLSKPADQLVTAWQAGNVAGKPAPEAVTRLGANMAIAKAIKVQGTPTFIWRKLDGSEGRLDGMPTSIDALLSSIGG